MKCSQTLSRTNYLPTSIVSRFFNASKFYLLPFWFATSVLIGSTAVVSYAAPPELAQVVVGGSVNRPTLKLGSQGERVSELQGALKLLGYYTGTVDGNFNQMTANAVSQFKQAAGLAPDGIVDGNTWQRLFPGEGTVASSPALPNPASKFPTPNSVTNNVTPEPKPSSPSTSQTTVRQSSSGNGTSTSRSEQTLRTTSTDGAGQTSSSEQIVRTTSTTGSGETVRTSRQTPRNQTSSSGETVRTSRQTPRNQTASSGETVRTSRQTPRNQTASSGETVRTSRQTSSSRQTPRTSRQASSSGQTTRQTPTIQYTAGGMPILRIGMRGSEVVKLQERLKRLGFLDGDVDGDFGPSTEAAVKAAQQRYGLESDGIAGGATWDALTRRRSQPL